MIVSPRAGGDSGGAGAIADVATVLATVRRAVSNALKLVLEVGGGDAIATRRGEAVDIIESSKRMLERMRGDIVGRMSVAYESQDTGGGRSLVRSLESVDDCLREVRGGSPVDAPTPRCPVSMPLHVMCWRVHHRGKRARAACRAARGACVVSPTSHPFGLQLVGGALHVTARDPRVCTVAGARREQHGGAGAGQRCARRDAGASSASRWSARRRVVDTDACL